jgi:hypothetical protein
MQKKNQFIIDAATELEDYARANDGLKGYKPKIPLISAPKTDIQRMSDAELKAEIARKKAQGK